MPRITITVPDKISQPYRFSLDRKSVTMGRGIENDIVIDCGSISVQHAEMKRVDGGFQIEDLGSTNGVKCDGKRQMKFMLSNGTKIYLGDVRFDFTLSDDELKELYKEKPPEEKPSEPTSSDIKPTEEKKATLPAEEHSDKSDVEDEEESEKKSRRKRSTEPKAKKSQVYSSSGAGTLAMLVLFLILAGAAFYAGAHIRHKRDTGEPLLKAIVNKGDVRDEKGKESKEKE